MELILTVVAIVILVVNVAQSQMNKAIKTNGDLPSFGENQTSPPESTPPSSTPFSIQKAPVTSTPKPSQDQNEYIYPGAHVVSSSSQNLELTSTDDPEKITSWYKDKITSKNYNVNSFVNTTANEVVLNKLSGGDTNTTVSVEISQKTSANPVQIDVKISFN